MSDTPVSAPSPDQPTKPADAMRPPLQALTFFTDNVQPIIKYNKTGTIRAGHRAFRPGEKLMLCAPWVGFCARVTADTVVHSTLQQMYDMHAELLRSACVPTAVSLDDFLKYMARYGPEYAALDADAPVTFIGWAVEDAEGIQLGQFPSLF